MGPPQERLQLNNPVASLRNLSQELASVKSSNNMVGATIFLFFKSPDFISKAATFPFCVCSPKLPSCSSFLATTDVWKREESRQSTHSCLRRGLCARSVEPRSDPQTLLAEEARCATLRNPAARRSPAPTSSPCRGSKRELGFKNGIFS